MIFFGWVKDGGGGDIGHYFLFVFSGLSQFFYRVFGGGFLLWCVVKDSGTILVTRASVLPIRGGGVMACPEDIEKLLI